MIEEVKVGDRFKYTPQVEHQQSEERIYRVVRKYTHPLWKDTRYSVVDEETGKVSKGYLLSNFQCRAMQYLGNNRKEQ